MSKKIAIPIIVVLLVAVGVLSWLHFENSHSMGLSNEQRQEFIMLAEEKDSLATQAQTRSEEAWALMIKTQLVATKTVYADMAKAFQDLASEYRQQALEYRTLAAKQ